MSTDSANGAGYYDSASGQPAAAAVARELRRLRRRVRRLARRVGRLERGGQPPVIIHNTIAPPGRVPDRPDGPDGRAGAKEAPPGRAPPTEPPPAPPDFVPTAFQEAVLAALEGRALRNDALAREVGERSRLFRHPGGLRELRERGWVAHHPRMGFYRPDAPPEQLRTDE